VLGSPEKQYRTCTGCEIIGTGKRLVLKNGKFGLDKKNVGNMEPLKLSVKLN